MMMSGLSRFATQMPSLPLRASLHLSNHRTGKRLQAYSVSRRCHPQSKRFCRDAALSQGGGPFFSRTSLALPVKNVVAAFLLVRSPIAVVVVSKHESWDLLGRLVRRQFRAAT